MALSSDFSRGNPQVSGAEDKHIKDAARESPHALHSQISVEITDCGHDNGVSCEELVFDIYNVMGQEDKYRHDGTQRVQRGGLARVVLTTTEKTDIDIEYVGNPSNEDNPTFQKSITNVSQGKKHHEFFFEVDPSTLYAFKLNAQASSCPYVTKQSGIYYFTTGSEFFFSSDSEIQVDGFLTVGLSRTEIFKTLSTNNYFGEEVDIDLAKVTISTGGQTNSIFNNLGSTDLLINPSYDFSTDIRTLISSQQV